MSTHIIQEGHYKLFETTKHHQILNLNNKNYYALITGQKGDIIVKSDSDHEEERTLHEGRFYLVDFEDDLKFQDMPHLFLEKENHEYQEMILPNGLPTENDHQKKIIKASGTFNQNDLEPYLKKAG